jgi:hypothetical protein
MGARYSNKIRSGIGQLSLVEHALCPMDSRDSCVPQLEYETSFSFTDNQRNRRRARVRVLCPLGLSPQDEFFLWGLLALTLADESNGGELHATRHYFLRRLGVIDANSRRGGRQYQQFTDAIDRLAAVQYFSDGFFDPIRSEHVRIKFQFFSYSMPINANSSRAWRIVWDPVFFQYASAARGALWFDLEIYRKLSVASRRLFLLARKLLGRRGADVTYPIGVRQLVVDVLGYSPSLPPSQQNARLRSCLAQLIEFNVLRNGDTRMYKRSKGNYAVVLARGKQLCETNRYTSVESPLLEPLGEIGFDPRQASKLLSQFSTKLLREWIDITLAKKERFGMQSFSKSPAAYLRYNLKLTSEGTGTPPDWWHELKKREQKVLARNSRKQRQGSPASELPQQAIDSLDSVGTDIFRQFLAAGQQQDDARLNARRFVDAVAQANRK